MTFGGIQGFTRKPSTPFTDDHGNFAGIIHQERNVTYALFQGAGHTLPQYVPEAVSHSSTILSRILIYSLNSTCNEGLRLCP